MGIFQQFPYSNFHEMNLDQIIKIMREMQDEWVNTKAEWASYKDYIDNYFANLDVSDEVLQAIRVMAADGSLNTVIDPVIVSAVGDWLDEHITITQGATVIDDTLSIQGAAADAKATGDTINNTKTYLENDISRTREATTNLAQAYTGRYYFTSADGVIRESGNTWVGMDDVAPCEPSTPYVFSCYDNGVSTTSRLYVAWYDSDKAFISAQNTNRAGTTFHYNGWTSPANAYYMTMCVYNSNGINEDSKLQITKGSVNPTAYIPPYSAVDLIARNLITELKTSDTLALRWGAGVMQEVVLLGDSIVQGVGSSDYSATGETIVTINNVEYKRNVGVKSWAAKFKAKIESEYYVMNIVNNGLEGQGIQVITEYLDSLVTANTKAAIVCVGVNNRSSGASTIQGYYEALFAALQNKGISVYALSPIDVNGATYNTSLALINTALERACLNYNVPYFNLYGEYNAVLNANTKSDYYNDTLHPNDKGYSTMYGVICKLLNF